MSPDCQKKHNRSIGGIAFASNIDPEMFDLGMRPSQASPRLSSWFPQKTKAFAENVRKMKLATLTLGSQEQRLVVYQMLH